MIDLSFGKPRLVGLCGPIGAGKSTLASEMRLTWGYKIVPFADKIKKMLRLLGLSHAQVAGAEKEDVVEFLLCGKTPRFALQTIGTEWGRETIGEDIWVNAWELSLQEQTTVQLIVADDVRFPNEVQRIKDLGGIVVRVIRRASDMSFDANTHKSERHMLLPADFTIINNGNRDDLVRKFEVELAAFESQQKQQSRETENV